MTDYIDYELTTTAGYLDLVDEAAQRWPECRVVLGRLRGPYVVTKHDPDRGIVRYDDFAYPAGLLAEPQGGFEAVEDRFGGALLVETQYLDDTADLPGLGAITYTEYREVVREAARDVDGAAAFLTGSFEPEGSWREAAGDNDQPRTLCNVQYPAALFTRSDLEPVRSAKTMFFGTLVLPQSRLTREARAFCCGDRGTPGLSPEAARPTPEMPPEAVNEAIDGLTPGDQVRVNQRSSRLTHIEESEALILPNDATVAFLEGNGTVYKVDRSAFGHHPELEWQSGRERITSIEVTDEAGREADAPDEDAAPPRQEA